MDAMTVLGWIVVAVLAVLGVELVHRRDRAVMRQASDRLHTATGEMRQAADVLRDVRGRQ